MTEYLRSISTNDKILLMQYPLCLLSFALPASSLSMGGQRFSQYLLTGYTGWVAFGVILFLGIIQAVFFYRKRKILKWMGLMAGIYAAWFALKLVYESNSVNRSHGTNNLAGSLQFSAAPMSGLFLLAIAGGLLFALSLAKIAGRRTTD